MTQTIDETMDFCPGMPQERRWFQFYGYGFALIENKTSQTLKVYSYDGADAVAWMCEEMLEIGLHEAEVVHARVNKDNNIYIKIYGSATGFLKGEHVRATCDELTLRCWEVTGGEAGQEVQLKQLADCDYKALITMACYMSPIPPGGRPCAATFPGSAQEYNAVFKANESPSDSETLPPTSPAESIDNKIDLPDNDKQQVATLPDNEKQQVATKDKTPRSRGKWRAVASITLAASAMLMEIAKQAWKALWKGEEIDWSALAFWLKNSVDTIAVNAQKLKETYGKSGGRKLLAILNAVTQLVEFITRLVSSIRYGGAHHWEALTSFLRMVLVIVLLVLEFKVDSNPWWKAWLPVFMVILDVKNIIMRLMELRDDSLNPKKWARSLLRKRSALVATLLFASLPTQYPSSFP